MQTILGISASPARCATVIKKVLTPPDVEAKIGALRAKVKEGEEEAKAELGELMEQQARLSSQTPISMAMLVDSIIKGLLEHGMKAAAEGAPKKMVHVANFHTPGVEGLPYYPLFANCGTWKGYNPEKEAELEAARTAQNKQVKQEREAAKKAAAEAGVVLPKAPKAPKAADEEGGKVSFTTYVDNALHVVKQAPDYAAMRVSGRVKEYVSDLVYEVVVRLSALSKYLVKGVMDVKTMTTEHVVAVVSLILMDAGKSPEEIKEVLAPVEGGLASFKSHQQSEKESKIVKMTPEKAEALAAKKDAAERQKMQRQAAQTRAKAIDLAEKAKALQAACAAAGIEPAAPTPAPAGAPATA